MKKVIVLTLALLFIFSSLAYTDDVEYIDKAVGIFSSYADLQKTAVELLVQYTKELENFTAPKEEFVEKAKQFKLQSQELYKASDLASPDNPKFLKFDTLFKEFVALADNYHTLLVQLMESETAQEIAEILQTVTNNLNTLKVKALEFKAEIDRLKQ